MKYMTEEQFKNRCAEILREHVTFSHQLGDFVIHGALDAIWRLHNEQNLNKPVFMQAEASASAEGESVASSAVAQNGRGCPKCKGQYITTRYDIEQCYDCGWPT